ncbi:MAG: hypothetical protein WCV84_06015, partial [Patescibacteria group bacterium]
FNVLAIAFGTVLGGIVGRGDTTAGPGRDDRSWTQVRHYLSYGLYAYGFAWVFTGFGSFGPMLDGMRPTWLVGVLLGMLLTSTAQTKKGVQPTILRESATSIRYLSLWALACYVAWIVVTDPSWWREEHLQWLGGSGRSSAYTLGWHAIGMLIAAGLSVFDSWFLGFPQEPCVAQRVEQGPFRTSAHWSYR